MLSSRAIFRSSISFTASRTYTTPFFRASIRSFTSTQTTMGKDSNMSRDPPKHEMAYFPGLTSEVRSFGLFRKVIHTGLYSQLVTMEIPVGGDIGEYVYIS